MIRESDGLNCRCMEYTCEEAQVPQNRKKPQSEGTALVDGGADGHRLWLFLDTGHPSASGTRLG